MKKNEEIVLTIEGLNDSGEGVARHDGMVVFIKGTIPGDVVKVGITALKRNYAYGRIIKIEKPSKDRIEPVCAIAGRCGGCQIMQMDYQAQLSFKDNKVREALVRIGGFEGNYIDSVRESIIGMNNPFQYRNKAQYPVGVDKDGRVVSGFFAPYSHRIIESECCYIGHQDDKSIIEKIKEWIDENNIPVYDEKSHKGLIRHIIIRHGFYTKETMVCLVVNIEGDSKGKSNKRAKFKESLKSLVNKLKYEISLEDIVSIVINYNPKKGNIILGNETENIYGKEFIVDEIHLGNEALVFNISANAFYQVNPTQMEKLYRKTIEYADIKNTDVVWDIYCGIGTITLFAAKHAKEVIGIEEVPQAIENAKANAKINNINNVSFMCSRAESVLDGQFDIKRPEVVILDPPRAGAKSEVLETILKANPNRIVYVSCNPATLARDLKILCSTKNYVISKVVAVDQFCHSAHVEVVTLLSKSNRKADSSIKLSLDMDEYYEIVDKEASDGK